MEILKINKKQASEDQVVEPPAAKEKEELKAKPPAAKEKEELKANCVSNRVSVPPRPPQPEDSEEEAGHYYQGLGWLFGLIGKTEEGKFQITLRDGTSFILTADRHIMYALAKQFEREPSQPLWIRCYPQYRIQEQLLYFKALYFSKEKPEDEDVQPGIFILRGIWQFIPQNRRPVFTVYRNQIRYPSERVRNQHLPLIWQEERPFRFRKDSDARPQFYQIEARLISRRGCLGWVRTIAGATKPPKHIRTTVKPADGKATTQGSPKKEKDKGDES